MTEDTRPFPDDKTRNIHQRIRNIQRVVEYVKKDVKVGTGEASYPGVSHDAVVAKVRSAMIDNGVNLVMDYDHERSPDLDVEKVQQVRGNGQPGMSRLRVFFNALFVAKFINIDNPSDYVSFDIPAHAMDFGDKAPGKAISYAKKYALLTMFLLETGIDEESRSAETDEFKAEVVLSQTAVLLKEGKSREALETLESAGLTHSEQIIVWGGLNSQQKKAIRDARQEILIEKHKGKKE